MLDRYQIRYFLAVVDQGNFSRAAAHCHVTQPTLSVGIAKLEQQTGTPLFLRNSQRVELTAAGAAFLGHARRIESEFNLALQSIGRESSSPRIRLGILRSIPGSVVADIARAAVASDRANSFELVEGSERELTAGLARGRIDCALTLVGRGGERFLEEPLRDEAYILALPENHALAGEPVVRADAFNGEVMIVRRHCEALSETSRHFTERGVRPHFVYRATNDERVLQLVAAGAGVTVMPDAYLAPGVARVRLAGFDIRRTIGLQYGSLAEPLASSPSALIEAARTLLRRR